ncbi:hypothetical protein A1O3_00474 [Capronia epimyces CBS 606.96]|uniref:Zn(2)-C6 fungal-type domain-containing protein n=1 Tax=Capronia epimyces CBS 606.96 TaxID=1182542 RepID=W9ZBP4_9EURO|nr:uncharacterized protein A1O3_00474 [Capronia epimyces CBS 606.96]EXJ91924.1 hypothetical protein A1O3_00474 [Capronia epimyces CBS 606.96]
MQAQPHGMKTARPYRSHKYPACTRCHKRRSRCTIEIPGQACLLCRMHGVACSSASGKKDDRVSPKVGFIHRSLVADEKSLEGVSSHIVGPVIARDTQILDQYLPLAANTNDTDTNTNVTAGHVNTYIHTNNGGGGGRREAPKPIYHVPIPPRRPSPADCHCARNLPAELLEQVDPFLGVLLDNYYDNIHPCYPITDEEYVLSQIKDHKSTSMSLSRTFVVNLVAYALFYWDPSAALATFPKPDQDFAWQAAVEANLGDMQKGDLETIVSICTNVSGRPSRCLLSNVTSVARAVALSHAIGLNHDCSEWKIGETKKRMRWKAWWAVVIQDRWFNFAQGTPPYISKGHYDVPLPTVDLLTRGPTKSVSKSPRHRRAAEVYIHFCRLTEIVGDVLPLIYHIRSGNDSLAAEQTSRSEIELNRWLESRPGWLNLHEFHNRPAVPGLLNLQLCYLSVRMLLRRIAWHEIAQRESDPASSWLLGCQQAAEDIVRFVASLHQHDLNAFWLPYSAHHFTSAVTLLLRCALETSFPHVRSHCMHLARTLVDCLRRYHDEYQWDLAETALPQCETFLKRIEDALPRSPNFPSASSGADLLNPHPHPNPNTNPSPTPGYLHHDGHENLLGNPLPDDGFAASQWHGSLEELFPDIFSDFTDTALLTGEGRLDVNE